MRRRDDQAVSEVLGFILTFALSAVFLMIALTSFYAARNNSDAVVTGVEMRAIADRVAGKIVEAGLVGQEFRNATSEVVVPVPQDLNGRPYYVTATTSAVWANSTGEDVSARATTFKLDAVQGFVVSGTAHSSNERITVKYSLVGGVPTITIRGD